ncbi:50S ribosomal protein L25/general stress protein Ctc [Actinotalea sp. Marseille-Q4924]|uniref:50S ribosomal protein L25/general stress protein Ctc n=1 Tax=Actinotalea sp. Marseille-Q4924 TaxID=2866571 RepID=UPI001CE3D8FE|nr:50S ribosomal protein L25/general stress protein Ctc [Actinotalea sp. Marseille-Q4924]
MSEIKLVATTRTEFGKGAARRIRRAHQVPAVIYGHGEAPVHITLPGHETMLALKHANALLSIELDGKAQLAIAKDIQRDPIKPVIEHVDLLAVRAGEKVTVDIPVHVTGEAVPGTVTLVEAQTLQVEAEATHIPESVEVSIEGLEAGSSITAGDVSLPSGVTLLGDPDAAVVVVAAERLEEEPTEGEETAEEPGAEGETAAEGSTEAESAEEA